MNQKLMQQLKKVKFKNQGFTLLELMIVVVVISILAAIAIPNYRDYVLRSRRSDAAIALTEIANLQEKFYSDNLKYVAALASLPYPTNSPEGYYSLVAAVTATSYNITAQPTSKGNQTDDTDCTSFVLNNLGQKSSSPQAAGVCWR